MDAALAECGVTEETLTAAETEALDRQGFCVFTDLIEAGRLAEVRAALEDAFRSAPAGASAAATGTRHTEELIWKQPAFEFVLTHPRLLAAAHHVLRRPFRLFQLSGRDPLPGFGRQGLHTDWMPRQPGEPYVVCSAVILLDEFTEESGATRVIPGSHLIPRMLAKRLQAPDAHHPDEHKVTGPAGAALVFNGHLWHSGTLNESDSSRRALQVQFVARDRVPPLEPPEPIPERLSAAARLVLGG